MPNKVNRIYVEKKPGFDVEAAKLFYDLKHSLGIEGLTGLRIVNRYDVEGLAPAEFTSAQNTVFSEPPVDHFYLENLPLNASEKIFAIEYLPGQYDQRADSASQCIQILTRGDRPLVRSAKLLVLKGDISTADFIAIKNYCINPLESREASLEKPASLALETDFPADVGITEGFIKLSASELEHLHNELGLAMSVEDLTFCQAYFQDTEKRNPTVTEIRLIDTYWSDHCRHTTFLTTITDVSFEEGPYTAELKKAYEEYLASRRFVYEKHEKDLSLMDLATIAMKELQKTGRLDDQETSDENNACSIVAEVDVAGKKEEWLVMFKNETHNHPTEIEPFGGAATCLGGAIRDPLSGRVYVYQAMRVTGSGDPRKNVTETLPGKLPQKKITTGAAAGYSSYGNQIGLATGQVTELYDEGFVAKRMEIGAVIGAAPRKNVKREKPLPGDIIILLGGRTGRDGCGGATGSSKEHTEESLLTCSAEVQKGNPPTERKIQRLFRNPSVSSLIKKSNDFGAGGVAVAIGELADGLEIYLDRIPKKYDGLDGTELAISESQERMAVVIAKEDEAEFMKHVQAENLEATVIAQVSTEPRLRMYWRDATIVNISRDFLDTNGVKQLTDVRVAAVQRENSYFTSLPQEIVQYLDRTERVWLMNLMRLNVCSQKGLVEMFDSTIGAATVLMPFGGRYQDSPQEGMAAKIPVLHGETTTGTLMSYGYNPQIGLWSPFHGALYAIVEACAKITAMGGDYRSIRLSLQEYFERLGKDPLKWGKPFAALLGAYTAQRKLGIPAIGGKDSMSGTFRDLNVPPTLVAFAVNVSDVRRIVSSEFKGSGSKVILLPLSRNENDLPDFSQLDKNYSRVFELAGQQKILAAQSVGEGGIAAAVSKMCFGNRIGITLTASEDNLRPLFEPLYGSLLLEISANENPAALLAGLDYTLLGTTTAEPDITVGSTSIPLVRALAHWESTLEAVFPTRAQVSFSGQPLDALKVNKNRSYPAHSKAKTSLAKPRVLIPVFPGTNCEYDTAKALSKAGAFVDTMIIRNLTSAAIESSIAELSAKIGKSQIIVFPGGFSAGDEPEGSGKFIAATFRNPYLKEAVTDLLQNRDGLILGICNGFQALVKLGLLPYGEIREIDEISPTLTFNTIGRHKSKMIHTKVTSTLSPWLYNLEPGTIHTIPASHGEGRFVASEAVLDALFANGQVASQYVDLDGNPSYDINFNPNGSMQAIEGITSPDGRVFGKMGHTERVSPYVAINIPGDKDQPIFTAGINYFR